MNIAEVVAAENFLLYVRADDGRAGFFDVKPYLDSEAFAPLRDPGEFARLHNGGYFVEWDCGADLSADTIQARWRIVPDDRAQRCAAGEAQSLSQR